MLGHEHPAYHVFSALLDEMTTNGVPIGSVTAALEGDGASELSITIALAIGQPEQAETIERVTAACAAAVYVSHLETALRAERGEEL